MAGCVVSGSEGADAGLRKVGRWSRVARRWVSRRPTEARKAVAEAGVVGVLGALLPGVARALEELDLDLDL